MCVRVRVSVWVPGPLRPSSRCDRCDRRDRRGCKSHRRSVNPLVNGKATRQSHCSVGPVCMSSACSSTPPPYVARTLASLDSVCCAASQPQLPPRQHTPAPRKALSPSQPARPPARQPPPHLQPSAPVLAQNPKSRLSDLASPLQRSNCTVGPFPPALVPPRRSSVSVPASAAAFRQSCSSTVPLDLGSSLYTDQPSFTTINRSAVGADAGAMCGIDWPLCNCVA